MFCNKCGKEIPNDSRVCKFCGNPVSQTTNMTGNATVNRNNVKVKKQFYQKAWFWILIVFVFIVFVGAIGSSSDKNTSTVSSNATNKEQELTNNSTAAQQEEQEITEEEYKKNCKKYEYKDIARNPQNYEGKLVTFDGEVIQVLEGYFNTVNFRINVTKNEYDFWEDTVYCSYTYSDNESKILEDDIVTLYGECEGTTTYTSILGQKITVPKINIKYIELIQE